MTLSVLAAAREAPHQVALVSDDAAIRYAELAERVAARMGALRGEAAPDQPFALVGAPDIDTVTTLLALLATGIPVLLLHPKATGLEREALVQRAKAVRVARAPAGVPDPEACAVILATSGSSGRPKLAKLSHRALLAAARASAAHLGVDPAERWIACLPLAHVGGLSILTRMLVARRASVLFDSRGSMLAALPRLAEALVQQRITLVSLVPTLLERLLDLPGFQARPPLRAIVLGGAATSAALLRRAMQRGAPVLPSYGLTETAAQICTRPLAALGEMPDADCMLAPSGRPLADAQIRIVDGQIEVRGPTLFSGYAEDHAAVKPEDWFRTHDRGFIDGHGELVVSGRSGECIVTGGENVDPAEVEAALACVPGVRGACVFGIPDGTFGEIVAAVVEGQAQEGAGDALAALLRQRISAYKVPRRVTWVAGLPLLASGKVDRGAARRLL